MVCAIAGSTGLIGRECLRGLLAEPRVQQVVSVSRRASGLIHDKLNERVSSFEELSVLASPHALDVGLCALGTTLKVAGSRQAFRRVDHDYVLDFARWCQRQGARRFLVVSAIGADVKSLFFYNRVKGETEADLKALGFEELVIFRPSLLLGARDHLRFGERVGEYVMTVVKPFLPSAARPIHATAVAHALVHAAIYPGRPGVRVATYADILAAAGPADV